MPQLFDIAKDPGENIDLAGQHPDILADLVNAWLSYAKNNDVVLLFPDTQVAPAVSRDNH
jgi:hypothetical protein